MHTFWAWVLEEVVAEVVYHCQDITLAYDLS